MANKNTFFMTDKRASSQIIRKMSVEYPRALTLWVSLKDISNRYGVAVASQEALSEILGVKSRQSVYNAVKYLRNNNYIEIGKIGNQNAYILNPNIVWQTSHNFGRRALAKHGIVFPGIITLTKKENRKLYEQYRRFTKNNKPVSSSYALNNLSLKHTRQGKATKNGEIIKHRNRYTSAKSKHQTAQIKTLKKKLRIAKEQTRKAKAELNRKGSNKKKLLNYNKH